MIVGDVERGAEGGGVIHIVFRQQGIGIGQQQRWRRRQRLGGRCGQRLPFASFRIQQLDAPILGEGRNEHFVEEDSPGGGLPVSQVADFVEVDEIRPLGKQAAD